MSAPARIEAWRRDGCDSRCWERRHDPDAHELYGRALERAAVAERVVRTGPLVIDLGRRTVAVSGRAVALNAREWRLLAFLAAHPGRQWTAYEVAWDVYGGMWTPSGSSSLHTIRVARSRLRSKLGDARRLVHTRSAGGSTTVCLMVEEPTS